MTEGVKEPIQFLQEIFPRFSICVASDHYRGIVVSLNYVWFDNNYETNDFSYVFIVKDWER